MNANWPSGYWKREHSSLSVATQSPSSNQEIQVIVISRLLYN